MKSFSPFGKGYKSSWYRYPSIAQLTRRTSDSPNNFKQVRELCGCDNCRMERRKAENFPELEAAE